MFCDSCEKYLCMSSLVCNFCCRKNTLKLKPKTLHCKDYTVCAIKKKQKGAKIKQQCPECKSEYLYYYTMQLRSADEGQTVFYECDCGYKEKLNT